MKTIATKALLLSMFFNIYNNAIAQVKDTNEPIRYVDFHAHPAMKNYYRNVPRFDRMWQPQFSEYIKNANWVNMGKKRWIWCKTGFSGVTGHGSYDQATYDLLNQGQASIICASIYSLEKQSTSKAKVLHIIPMRTLNNWAVTKITMKRQKTAFNCTGYEEYKGQIAFLEKQSTNYTGYGKAVKIADRVEQLNDTSVIWLLITAEGAHNFYGYEDQYGNQFRDFHCDGSCMDSILSNLKEAKNKHRLFFVTTSHLFWNKVSGFARGLDIDKPAARKILARQMWSKNFANVDGKDAEGIIYIRKKIFTPSKKDSVQVQCECLYDLKQKPDTLQLGYAFIDSLWSRHNDFKKPTYVDMRHMDVKARIEYMNYRAKYVNETHEKIPLIVSHAAVNGKNLQMAKFLGSCPIFDDYDEYINPKKYYKKELTLNGCGKEMGFDINGLDKVMDKVGWFHPMSNNLFDEEIDSVYKSDGIIGLSMEERALGKNTYNYRHHCHNLRKYIASHIDGFTYANKSHLREKKYLKKLELAEPFVRNMLYIVKHSGVSEKEFQNLEDWKHIAIGSDFDGIMNPIDICATAADIPAFFSFLADNLNLYADYLGERKLLHDKDPKILLRRVFYQNGEEFIKRYF
ncbi:MAG: peptidase [Bacteroidota bacterium]|nr:peptidase [Bacteroidota bacterium]